MTLTLEPRTEAPGATERWHLPAPVSFALLASLLVSFLVASSAPTPLYATYQAEWHFSPITTTVIFGTYALAVLASLLTFGKLSDHIGRRPVLITAIVLQAVAMLIFETANGVPALVIGRIIGGLATGAAAGAIGAALLDLNPNRGSLANAVAAPAGTGLGAIIGGLFGQFLPAPTHLVYLALIAVLLVQATGVVLMRETVTRRAGAAHSLIPEFVVPAGARRPLLIAAPALFAVWALGGFYASLGPALIRTVTGSDALVLGGLGLFALAGAGSLAVFLLRKTGTETSMMIGTGLVIAGTGITLVGINASSSLLFFAGTVIAGGGFGASFQGGIRMVMPHAEAHQRAGLLSVIYSISYIGLGAPAVIAGFLVVHDGGLLDTAREFAVAVIALAALALAGLLTSARRAAEVPALAD